jgi:type IV pilus assembly protein PilV
MKRPELSPCATQQRGLSLVEALIAVLLITLALLGLISLQARTVQLSSESEDVQRASLLANEMATAMLAEDSLSVSAGTLAAWQTRVGTATDAGLPGGTGDVTVDGQVATIRVSWTPPRAGGASSVYLTTVMLPVQSASAP